MTTTSEYKVHLLKVRSSSYVDTLHRLKTCEVRRNDRGYTVGDKLKLREWDHGTRHYTGRSILVTVTHINELRIDGIKEAPHGWVVLSFWIDEDDAP